MRGKLSSEQRLKQNNQRLKSNNLRLRQEKLGLQKENQQLKDKVQELEQKLENKELQRKNLQEKIYKTNKKGINAKPLGKKPGERGYSRKDPQPEDVTEEVKFIPNQCPYCHQHDLKPSQKTIIKYQEDIVIVPHKIIKKYVITKHWCPHCQEYVKSDKIPPNILNLERIGPNVLAYVLYARYRLRLPFNKIQQSLKDLHNFEISEGELANQLAKAQEIFHQDFEAIKELIKISDVVYCDETGWRVRGQNFWIWVFVTKEGIRYLIEDTRGKRVAEQALGDKEDRTLISDFYAAYGSLPGNNQYCWVHLLRDSKKTESPLHEDLKQVYENIKLELAKEISKRDFERLDRLLENIAIKKYPQKNILAVKKLQKRIAKTKEQLLECLKHDDVLPQNNTAERALRNNVVMRKIFGCSRSLSSAKIMETNTSVIDSLLLQNPHKSFFEVILPKLKKNR